MGTFYFGSQRSAYDSVLARESGHESLRFLCSCHQGGRTFLQVIEIRNRLGLGGKIVKKLAN